MEYEKIWRKRIIQHIEQIQFLKPRKRVRFYKIKKIVNKIFKTNYELYIEEPKKKGEIIKFIGIGEKYE